MNWLLSILIGILTAAFGAFASGFLGTLNVRWYRISSFEGGSGYYVAGFGLLGIIVGLIAGIVGSRVVGHWTEPTFFRGLGAGVGSMTALVFTVGFLCWLAADLPPKYKGREVELLIEIKTPPNFKMPVEKGSYGPYAYIDLIQGRSQAPGELQVDEAKQVDGRWIVTATVPWQTSTARKFLRAYFSEKMDVLFPLYLKSKPREKDLVWSRWIEASWNADQQRPAPEDAYFLRYKVVVIDPPAPVPYPTEDEVAAQRAAEAQAEFDAIPDDAPITEWLRYTEYGSNPERMAAAVRKIEARSNFAKELSALMNGDQAEDAAKALYAIEHLNLFPDELVKGVAKAGRKIAAVIRDFNGTSVEADPSFEGAANASIRFSAWMSAVRTLHERTGTDFTTELREILELSRVREDSHVMRADIRRVASYYMHEWAGLEPLPGDPKPR